MSRTYYQIFKITGEYIDLDNPYNDTKFDNQYEAEDYMNDHNIDTDEWKIVDIEEF